MQYHSSPSQFPMRPKLFHNVPDSNNLADHACLLHPAKCFLWEHVPDQTPIRLLRMFSSSIYSLSLVWKTPASLFLPTSHAPLLLGSWPKPQQGPQLESY